MSSDMRHISDTALLVAAARAAELDRPDGLIKDPYAARLAGERGAAMLLADSRSPQMRWLSFGIGLRSRFIDEYLEQELRDKAIECVLCLGAGLDARPWRLPLPETLHWIEVDFAPILDYKHDLLKDVAPRCRLDRMTADLNREGERHRVLDEAAGRGRTLLITEGLLFYLPSDTVRNLALDSMARSSYHSWILDITSNRFTQCAHGNTLHQLTRLRHDTCLDGDEVIRVVGESGWSLAGRKTFIQEGMPFAIERAKINSWKPDPNAPVLDPDDPAGVWLFER